MFCLCNGFDIVYMQAIYKTCQNIYVLPTKVDGVVTRRKRKRTDPHQVRRLRTTLKCQKSVPPTPHHSRVGEEETLYTRSSIEHSHWPWVGVSVSCMRAWDFCRDRLLGGGSDPLETFDTELTATTLQPCPSLPLAIHSGMSSCSAASDKHHSKYRTSSWLSCRPLGLAFTAFEQRLVNLLFCFASRLSSQISRLFVGAWPPWTRRHNRISSHCLRTA